MYKYVIRSTSSTSIQGGAGWGTSTSTCRSSLRRILVPFLALWWCCPLTQPLRRRWTFTPIGFVSFFYKSLEEGRSWHSSETWSSARFEIQDDAEGRPLPGPRPLRGDHERWAFLDSADANFSRPQREMPFSCKGSSYVCQSQSWVARPRWNTPHPHCKQNGPLCGGQVSSRCSPARASLFRRYTFQQWKHGAAGIKPTTLLYSHAPIPTVFIENEQHELTKPTVQLIGRNQSGANRAAQAKECPEGMSHSLALAFWQRIQIRLRSLDLTGELQFPPN